MALWTSLDGRLYLVRPGTRSGLLAAVEPLLGRDGDIRKNGPEASNQHDFIDIGHGEFSADGVLHEQEQVGCPGGRHKQKGRPETAQGTAEENRETSPVLRLLHAESMVDLYVIRAGDF